MRSEQPGATRGTLQAPRDLHVCCHRGGRSSGGGGRRSSRPDSGIVRGPPTSADTGRSGRPAGGPSALATTPVGRGGRRAASLCGGLGVPSPGQSLAAGGAMLSPWGTRPRRRRVSPRGLHGCPSRGPRGRRAGRTHGRAGQRSRWLSGRRAGQGCALRAGVGSVAVWGGPGLGAVTGRSRIRPGCALQPPTGEPGRVTPKSDGRGCPRAWGGVGEPTRSRCRRRGGPGPAACLVVSAPCPPTSAPAGAPGLAHPGPHAAWGPTPAPAAPGGHSHFPRAPRSFKAPLVREASGPLSPVPGSSGRSVPGTDTALLAQWPPPPRGGASPRPDTHVPC